MIITTIFLVVLLVIVISLILYSSEYLTLGYTTTNVQYVHSVEHKCNNILQSPSVNCRGWCCSSVALVNALILAGSKQLVSWSGGNSSLQLSEKISQDEIWI